MKTYVNVTQKKKMMFGSKFQYNNYESELQLKGGLMIIQRLFCIFLNENICCDHSLEPSQ